MAEYSTEDKEEMVRAHTALIKARRSRLQELIEFVKASGFQKIGIANCFSMQKYADKLAAILRENGFLVYAVNCKESGLDGCMISDGMKGPCCDPVSQAAYLNESKTELFQKYSHAPVTTFIVKDFAHNHRVIESLE